MTVTAIKKELRSYASEEKAAVLRRFFKTGPGEYGEGDFFLGVKIPEIRETVKKYYLTINAAEIRSFVRSGFHEERVFGFLVLVYRYAKAQDREEIYKFYTENLKFVNNWDLVDLTAPHIAGAFLADKGKEPLYAMAGDDSLWVRRIAIIATFYFIRENKFDDSLRIAKRLLKDEEDLIHKAVGWMLREIGKRDRDREEAFLGKHYKEMPRTMLRYAIEKFPEKRRQGYLKGKI